MIMKAFNIVWDTNDNEDITHLPKDWDDFEE